MGIYVKFIKITHQIWSCLVTLASNSENFYFSPNSVLNFGKSYQIWGKLAQEQKCYIQKTNLWGGKHIPPHSAHRVNWNGHDIEKQVGRGTKYIHDLDHNYHRR